MKTKSQLIEKPSQKFTCPHLGLEYRPFAQSQLENPYLFYQYAREREPLFYSPMLGGYVLTRYEDIVTVIKDAKRFSAINAIQPVAPLHPEVVI